MKQSSDKKNAKKDLRQLSDKELSQVTGGIAETERRLNGGEFTRPLPKKPVEPPDGKG